jgi:hypothetical protein
MSNIKLSDLGDLGSPRVGDVIECEAHEIYPLVKDILLQAERKATAEEALATAMDLWRDLMALENDTKGARRRKNSGVDQAIYAGQIIAIKQALTRHFARHSALAKVRT